jgi:DNA-binding CsgD family transcriptional regulator
MRPDSRAADAADAATKALAQGALVRDPDTPDFACGTALYPLVFAGRFETVEREVDRVFDYAQATGSPDAFIVASCIRCDLNRLRGNLVAAVADGELMMRRADMVPDTPALLRADGVTLAWLVEVQLLRGDAEAARRLVEWRSEGRDLDAPEAALLHHARGLVALHDGEYQAAADAFARVRAVAEESGYEDRTTPWRLELARALAALGDPAGALELVGAQLELARTWGAPGGIGVALRARAAVGPREETIETLGESVELLEEAGLLAQLAGARIDLGSALRRARRRAEGREQLEQGLDGAARCGALADVERAQEELRVLGARPRRLAFSGIESLTASERRVATMAAEGMTNREIAQTLFVTQKTVEAHLSRTYRKLDISSRDQLPGALS